MGHSLALRNNKGRSLHNNWLGTWSKLPADETFMKRPWLIERPLPLQ
jgi:hypothetical protein